MIATIDLPPTWRRKHLTAAEQRVVELIVAGLSPKDAAQELRRSLSTVRNQLYTAMKKLGLRNRYELAAYFRPVSIQSSREAGTQTETLADAI